VKVAIVTSVYGGYDQPTPLPVQDIDCEQVLVTDRPCDDWPGRVVVEPRPQLHPRLAAKVAKCRPDLYADADAYVWVDASFQVTAPDFTSWAVSHLEQGPVAQFVHPARRHITAEADASATMTKYAGLPLREQAAHYIARGYPDGWGLWATGLIAYRAGGDLRDLGDAWLREQMRWTYQDQLSEAPVLYAVGLKVVPFGGQLYRNERYVIRGHRDEL
jgi:hypothetical protein